MCVTGKNKQTPGLNEERGKNNTALEDHPTVPRFLTFGSCNWHGLFG
jgi:hypothetical protein